MWVPELLTLCLLLGDGTTSCMEFPAQPPLSEWPNEVACKQAGLLFALRGVVQTPLPVFSLHVECKEEGEEA